MLTGLEIGDPRPAVGSEAFLAGTRWVALRFVRNPRARRYVLRLAPDGAARVTIPRGGNPRDARAFALSHRGWLERQLDRHAEETARPQGWLTGELIHFRGTPTPLTLVEGDGHLWVKLADEVIPLRHGDTNLRPAVESHLWRLARRDLPPRVFAWAARYALTVRRVTVRNQRSRWGSCSRQGAISLNWRIIQAPESVRDYLILHELMHLRHMNHSARFWQAVEEVCPSYREAEGWLKSHALLLR